MAEEDGILGEQEKAGKAQKKKVKGKKPVDAKSLVDRKLKGFLKKFKSMFVVEPCYVQVIASHVSHDVGGGSPSYMRPHTRYEIVKPAGDARNRYCIKVRGLEGRNPYSSLDKGNNTEKVYLRLISSKSFKRWFKVDEVTDWMKDLQVPMKDGTHEEVCPFNVKKFVEEIFKQHVGAHKQWLYMMADPTCKRDQVVMDAMISACFPIPMNRIDMQAYQGHILLLTNSSTGKSWAFRNLTGTVPSEHFTTRGLLGGFTNDIMEPGALSWCGAEMADEFANMTLKPDDKGIIEDLLNYCIFGYVVRKIKGNPKCKGTKTIILSGNVVHRFKKVMRLMSHDLNSTEMVGRRFCYFIYQGDLAKYEEREIIPREREEFSRVYREILETLFFEYDEVIWKVFEKNMWLITKDDDFKRQLHDLANRAFDSWLADYIRGVSISTQNIKFMALKQWFYENLDRVILGKVDKMSPEQAAEFDMIYQRKKCVILGSFENIVGEKDNLNRFRDELYKLGIDPLNDEHLSSTVRSSIMLSLGISEQTVYNYWKKLKSGFE